MVNLNKRILYLDQLRSLAIICVIIGHVCTFFGEGSYVNWMFSTAVIFMSQLYSILLMYFLVLKGFLPFYGLYGFYLEFIC